MKKLLLIVAASMMILIASPNESHAAKVYWDGMELKDGQIGRLTVTNPVNLWKRTEKGLQLERVLAKGERFRVYRIDGRYGGQYGVGNNLYITNVKNHVRYETPSRQKQKLLSCDAACLVEYMMSLPEEEYDTKAVEQIKTRLKGLPEQLLVQIVENDIKMNLVNGPITDTKEFAYLKDVTPRGWEGTDKTWNDVPGVGGGKNIVIRIGYSDKGKGHGSMNLELHELAHSIDSLIKHSFSSSPAFQEAWKSEVRKLFPNEAYFQQYSEEYFAEAFALFYYDDQSKKELLRLAPNTYELIHNLYAQ